jgi:hypothetical protein
MSPVHFVPEHEFIEQLSVQIQNGYGLVPFIGSGCSADSGILMGEQFTDYLAWTVFLCVAAPKKRPLGTAVPRTRWDLRRKGWPQPPTHENIQAARKWALGEFRRIAVDCGLEIDDNPQTNRIRGISQTSRRSSTPDSLVDLLHAPLVPPFLRDPDTRHTDVTEGHNLRRLHGLLRGTGVLQGGLVRPSISPTSEDAIVERAIRALYDWRATLHFLAELDLSDEPDDEQPLSLREADQTVIDGFNVHITRGKRPNLIHIMLGHLRRPTRMRLILTTNFDTLIEDAFADQHQRLDAISVSVKGGLPDPDIVHSRDTVVKLHGSLSETRADFSLDELPSLTDRQRFFAYVRGGPPDRKEERFIPGHLLVAGYSGSDARCVQLMKFVLDSDPGAMIFWVCQNQRDRDRVSALFPEDDYEGRLLATTVERTDLMLLELYQRLCFCLPPGGTVYQLNHNVPPGISFRPDSQEGELPMNEAAEAVAKPLTAQLAVDGIRALVAVDGPSGVMRSMQAAFESISRRHSLQKVWLELEDYGDTGSVAHALFQFIALQRGQLRLNHAQLSSIALKPPSVNGGNPKALYLALRKNWETHIERLCTHLNVEPRRWLVALYGRNGPGGCCGWDENDFWKQSEYGDRAGKVGVFTAFLDAMVRKGFTVIYAPYTAFVRDHDARCRDDIKRVLAEYNGSPEMARIAAATTDEHFKVPDAVVAREDLEHWLKSSKGDVTGSMDVAAAIPLHWVDLSRHLQASRRPGDSRYSETMKAVLRMGLTLEPGPGNDTDPRGLEQASARYNVIYASSLFRQSRHYSAFLSEAVFRCPASFNAYGFDNDLMRQRRLEQWLVTFNRFPEVFFRKPGGFAWMYRDVRMGLRCISEAVSAFVGRRRTTGNGSSGSEGIAAAAEERAPSSRLLPCRELRSRTHFWIGDWYLRAYQTSTYAGTLVEAMYHFYQAILHSRHAKPAGTEDPIEYRMHLWRTSLGQLVRTLRMSVSSMRFWLSPDQTLRYFGEKHVEEIVRQVNQARPDRTPRANYDRVPDNQVLRLLKNELAQLKERVRPEQSSGHRPRFQTYLSLHGISGSLPGDDIKRAEKVPDIDVPGDRWWRTYVMRPVVKDIFKKTEGHVVRRQIAAIERKHLKPDPAEAVADIQELLEWADLVMRRTKRAELALCPQPVDPGRAADSNNDGEKYRRVFLPMSIRRQWVRACVLARCGLDASQWLFPGLEHFVARQTSKALAIYGISLAHLHRFHEAHRRFNHAQTLVADGFGRSEGMLQCGILDLRRAEAYLIEAAVARDAIDMLRHAFRTDQDWAERKVSDVTTILGKGLSAAFAKIELLVDTKESGRTSDAGKALWLWLEPYVEAFKRDKRTSNGTLGNALRRLSLARADDAWGCLERAAWLFGGRTTSPGWWGRLRALQLGAYAATQNLAPPGSRDPTPRTLRPLCQRVRHDGPTFLRTLWEEGKAAAPDDLHNRLRGLDYYTQALFVLPIAIRRRAEVQADLQRVRSEIADIDVRFTKAASVINGHPGRSGGGLMREYCETLKRRIDQFCGAPEDMPAAPQKKPRRRHPATRRPRPAPQRRPGATPSI